MAKKKKDLPEDIINIIDGIMNNLHEFDAYEIALNKAKAEVFAWQIRRYVISDPANNKLKDGPTRRLMEAEEKLLKELSATYEKMAKQTLQMNENGFYESSDPYVNEGRLWACKRIRDNAFAREINNFKKKQCSMGYSLWSLKKEYHFSVARGEPKQGPARDFYSRDTILYVMAETAGELNANLDGRQRAKLILDLLVASGAEKKPKDFEAKSESIRKMIDRVKRQSDKAISEIRKGKSPEYQPLYIEVFPIK